MSIERPDWNNLPSTTVEPSTESAPPADNAGVPAAPTPRTTNYNGVVRQDWSYQKDGTTPAKADASDDVAETGLSAALTARFEREGGVPLNLARAQATATSILNQVDDPTALAASFDTLPDAIRMKAIDHLRLTPNTRGLSWDEVANMRLRAWEDSLTEKQLETARAWFAGLSKETRRDILFALGGLK